MAHWPKTKHPRTTPATWVAAIALAVAGCAGTPRPPVVPPLLGDGLRGPVPTSAREQPQPADPAGAVTLADVLALAMLRSPDLTGYALEIRAQEAEAIQSGRFANPELAVLVEDFGAATSVAGAPRSPLTIEPQTTVQLSQLVELGGKRGGRRGVALLGRDLAAWDYEIARIDVLTRTTQAFIDLLAAQERVTLAEEAVSLVHRVTESVSARVAAGMVSPVELTRAEAAEASADLTASRARRTRTAARAALAATWGGTAATFDSAAGDLRLVSSVPTFEVVVARLAEAPQLARWNSELAMRNGMLALARASRIPSLTVTAGIRRFGDLQGSAFVLGGSLALPLFDLNGPGIQAAQIRVAQAAARHEAAQASATASLASAYEALAAAHEELTTLGTIILPRSQEAFEAMTEGYRLGRFEYLTVLDAQRELIEAGTRHLDALAAFHKSWAEVERHLGLPLRSLTTLPAPEGQE